MRCIAGCPCSLAKAQQSASFVEEWGSALKVRATKQIEEIVNAAAFGPMPGLEGRREIDLGERVITNAA